MQRAILNIVVRTREQIIDKMKLSFDGLKHVFGKPRYVVFGTMVAVILGTVIYFSINSGYYGTLLVAPMLSFGDKVSVIGTMYSQLGQEIVTTFMGFVLFVVALLQGSAFSLMLYNLRRNKRMDTGSMSKSGLAVVAAAIGLGCVPCGTSLILPLVSLLFSSGASAVAAANALSTIMLVIALFLSIYSVYSLGYIAVAHKAVEELTVKTEGVKNEN